MKYNWKLCYADDAALDAAAAAASKAAGDALAAEAATAAAAAAAKAAAETVEDLPESAKGKTVLTQAEFNRALKEDRLKHKSQVEKSIKELETLRKSQSMSEKDRQQLQTRIDEMQNSLLTKEELAKKERERLENAHKQSEQTLKTERDLWQNRFHQSTIKSVMISEAVKADAFDPDGIIAILGPNTRLVEEVDADGKGLDVFTPKVKFQDTDEEGKSISLDLTVEQVVKRMKEIPKFGYLFKGTAVGGLGGAANPAPGQKPDVAKMTPAQYREYRKKNNLGRKSG